MEGEAKEWWEGLGSSSEAQWGSLHVLNGSDHYHAKIWCDDNSFSLLLTDLKSVWGCRRRETEVDEDRERYAPRLRSDNDDQTLRKKTLELIQDAIRKRHSKHKIEDVDDGDDDGAIKLKSEMKVSVFKFTWEFHCRPVGSISVQRDFICKYFISSLLQALREHAFLAKHKTEVTTKTALAQRAMFDTFCATYSLRGTLEEARKSEEGREEKKSAPSIDPDDDLFLDDLDVKKMDSGAGMPEASRDEIIPSAQPEDDEIEPEEEPKPRPKKKRKKRKKFV
ncbi:hypothetical protein AAMO2058_000768400 [Amorphochlora amoebiformis]